jgi:DNA-binding protein HU-beta
MNRMDLIYAVSIATDIPKPDVARAVDVATQCIMRAVASGELVRLSGFGTFRSARRSARGGKNPRTGETIVIAASTVPRFVPGRAFRESVATRQAKQKIAPRRNTPR